MSKLKTVRYTFEDGVARYVYRYKHHLCVGIASCHDDDRDFESRMLGLDLAETRAYLEYIKIRRDELIIKHRTLEGMYRHLSNDKNFNEKDFYAVKFSKEIKSIQEELRECREAIINIPKMLDSKIKDRESMYQKLRQRRASAEAAENNLD